MTTKPVAPEPTAEVAGKGRATPKRREAAPKRQPIAAPRTPKEATQWRKQQRTQVRKGPSGAKPLSTKEYRAAIRRGDESVLTRRDKGPVRKLARDWVDTHRMASNYLFPVILVLLLVSFRLPRVLGNYLPILVFALFIVEWLWAGRQIHNLAASRHANNLDKAWVLGMYAGQRAFLPRRYRSPQAKLRPGDAI